MNDNTTTHGAREVQQFEGEPLTAREVRIAREGFHDGAVWAGGTDCRSAKAAEVHFPLPKITRPRRTTDPHIFTATWLVVDGCLHVQFSGQSLNRYPRNDEKLLPTVTRAGIWADLLANPTEEVEAE